MKSFVLLAGALLASTAAAAQAPSGSQSGTEADDPNQRICRNIADLGTRLSRRRVCKTRQEWAEERRDSRNAIDRAQGPRGSRDNN